MAKSRIVATHEAVAHEVVLTDKKTVVLVTHLHRLTTLTTTRERQNLNVPFAELSNECQTVQAQAVDSALVRRCTTRITDRRVRQGPTVHAVLEALDEVHHVHTVRAGQVVQAQHVLTGPSVQLDPEDPTRVRIYARHLTPEQQPQQPQDLQPKVDGINHQLNVDKKGLKPRRRSLYTGLLKDQHTFQHLKCPKDSRKESTTNMSGGRCFSLLKTVKKGSE